MYVEQSRLSKRCGSVHEGLVADLASHLGAVVLSTDHGAEVLSTDRDPDPGDLEALTGLDNLAAAGPELVLEVPDQFRGWVSSSWDK